MNSDRALQGQERRFLRVVEPLAHVSKRGRRHLTVQEGNGAQPGLREACLQAGRGWACGRLVGGGATLSGCTVC